MEKGSREPGLRLVKAFAALHNANKPDYRALFEQLLNEAPLPWLIERLDAVMTDQTKPPKERLDLANAMMPTIERRKAEEATNDPPAPGKVQAMPRQKQS